ncbi:hypothetical protein J3R30DRAFT_3693486 [Lentinula aciculospora]|uniref:C3H1-type domain-containing protein n=1 Tax=Lentinula aciculospora TaxID=153920 RepID=A0A9W9DXV7_9AGAR|nr:hypothetical protein J3R30DRAFT_3693486 [Lentinula aciculospora]
MLLNDSFDTKIVTEVPHPELTNRQSTSCPRVIEILTQKCSLASPPTCWNYVRGHCSYKKCKYYHPTDISFPPYQRNSPFASSKPLPFPYHNDMIEEATEDWRKTPRASSTVYTPVAWKTAPCRKFLLTGSCPLGDRCKFIHDRDVVHNSLDARGHGQLLTDTIAPSKAHCWAFVQGKCKNPFTCRYFHPENPRAYMKYTPCLLWPKCPVGERCSFKHPKPLHNQLTPAASNPGSSVFRSGRLTIPMEHCFPSKSPLIASGSDSTYCPPRRYSYHPVYSSHDFAYDGFVSAPPARSAHASLSEDPRQPNKHCLSYLPPGHARRISVPVRLHDIPSTASRL